ncbi:TPA: hypothetical protein DCZ39_02000 [Patescibacteria group bacterium]|nr:hypothetical protein [Candidatus Gracilibacteria bacterium]
MIFLSSSLIDYDNNIKFSQTKKLQGNSLKSFSMLFNSKNIAKKNKNSTLFHHQRLTKKQKR